MDNFNNQIVNTKISKISKIEGERMIKENEFFKDLVSLMENAQFKNFFKKHLCDWVSVKSTVIYMKLYNELKTKYKKLTDKELEESVVIYLLSKIMRDNNIRPITIKTIDKIYENGCGSYFEELENYIDKKERKI